VDIASALELSYDQTAELVAHLGQAELEAPSPCSGWDVRATLNHLVGTTWMFTLVNQGELAGEDAGDVIGDAPKRAVAAAAKENVAAWRRPGGLDGDRTYPFGTFPAGGAALINLEEVVVHNWDIARGTGQELTIDADIAQTLYDWGLSFPLDDLRAHGAFGPEIVVAPSAPITDRLMALLGRQP